MLNGAGAVPELPLTEGPGLAGGAGAAQLVLACAEAAETREINGSKGQPWRVGFKLSFLFGFMC